MSHEFSKCCSIRRMSLLLSPKNNLSSFSFCILRSLLGCGFREMSKDGVYPKVTSCIHAPSSHVYLKMSFLSYAAFGCDCSIICLAELQKPQGKFAVSSPSVCRILKTSVLWLYLSRGGEEVRTRPASTVSWNKHKQGKEFWSCICSSTEGPELLLNKILSSLHEH